MPLLLKISGRKNIFKTKKDKFVEGKLIDGQIKKAWAGSFNCLYTEFKMILTTEAG